MAALIAAAITVETPGGSGIGIGGVGSGGRLKVQRLGIGISHLTER
jgi:hypothetical protein